MSRWRHFPPNRLKSSIRLHGVRCQNTAISSDKPGRIFDKLHVFVFCIHEAISVVGMVETLERLFCVEHTHTHTHTEKGITLSQRHSETNCAVRGRSWKFHNCSDVPRSIFPWSSYRQAPHHCTKSPTSSLPSTSNFSDIYFLVIPCPSISALLFKSLSQHVINVRPPHTSMLDKHLSIFF